MGEGRNSERIEVRFADRTDSHDQALSYFYSNTNTNTDIFKYETDISNSYFSSIYTQFNLKIDNVSQRTSCVYFPKGFSAGLN
jgi:hypothetical protein